MINCRRLTDRFARSILLRKTSLTLLLSAWGANDVIAEVLLINSFIAGAAADCGKVRGPIIAEVPLDQIRRPLLRTRNNDPEKVKVLMESIAEIGLQEPVGHPNQHMRVCCVTHSPN